MQGRFVAYYRVSTDRQGQSALGLEGQQSAVRDFLNGGDWSLTGEYTEIESGKRSDRPELARALTQCRLTGATLVVAKLDRLARNSAFLMSVVDGSGEGGVVFCDLPTIPAGPVGRFIIQQMANVAELEAGLISQRTKAALQAAKARGTKLGGFRGHVVDHRLAIEKPARRSQRLAQSSWRPCCRTCSRVVWSPAPDGCRTGAGRHPHPTWRRVECDWRGKCVAPATAQLRRMLRG